MTGVGLGMYDAMSWRRGRDEDEEWSPDRHRTVSGSEAIEMAPALAGPAPTAAYLFYDCQTDDARLVLSILGEAERFGAVCVNRCEATGLVERGGRAAGLLLRDTAGGGEFELEAANVINATGVWADRLRPDELYRDEEVPRIRPSRGTHIMLARESLPLDAGVIVPAGGGRMIFALPWLGRTLVGTTDNDYDGPLDHVPPSQDDVSYLLEALNGFFGTELSRADLTGAYAGVRPLIASGDPKKSVDISRRAELFETSSGLVTITGGKLTTWRRMAKQAVDRVAEREGREAPCRTHEIPLGAPLDAADLTPAPGIEADTREHLARRYGHAAQEVVGRVAPIPSSAAASARRCRTSRRRPPRRRPGSRPPSCRDVLLRRTRLGLLDARGLCAEAAEGPRLAAEAMAGELGWDEERVAGAARRLARRCPGRGPPAGRRPGARAGGGGMRLRLRGRVRRAGRPAAHGHRQRHPRLVLRSPRAQAGLRGRGPGTRPGGGRRRADRHRRRIGPHRHRGGASRGGDRARGARDRAAGGGGGGGVGRHLARARGAGGAGGGRGHGQRRERPLGPRGGRGLRRDRAPGS